MTARQVTCRPAGNSRGALRIDDVDTTARVALAARAAGGSMTAAVAAHYHVARRTAGKYLQLARRAGHPIPILPSPHAVSEGTKAGMAAAGYR